MNEPTTLPEVIAYLTAKFTAGTNLSRVGESRPEAGEIGDPSQARQDDVAGGSPACLDSRSSALPAQNPLSQTQILHLLELGLANPSKQEDRR